MIQFISVIVLFFIIIFFLINKYYEGKNNKFQKENTVDNFCNKYYKAIWVILSIIIFITVIYKFGEIPYYIGVDEAGMIYDANNLAEYGTDRYMNSYPLYLTNFGSGQSSLCAYLVTFCIMLFGANIISYRLPTLIIYLMSVIVSYLLISKAKNKKTALLFTFLIITCPWNIWNARMALDCNLYAGLFMLDLYLLDKAKKSYQYLIAGISIGVTLYTYCLSWITMPFFLLGWSIYMFYIKRLKIKQLVILGIPIAIFAMPLIYFILLNYGIVNQTKIGIFTLPVLQSFGASSINIVNWFRYGGESIKTIFLSSGTIYLIYIPLFIIGYILEIKQAIQEIKNKQYGISSIMVIAFTTLFLGLLSTLIPTPNKANVLYIPILYFVTSAIIYISRNSKIILTIFLATILLLLIDYEYYYYTYRGTIGANYYEDIYLTSITRKIENDENAKKLQKYVLTFKCSPYIYNLIEANISPEEYMNTVQEKDYNSVKLVSKVGNYNYIYFEEEIKELKIEDTSDYIFIIRYDYKDAIKYIEEKDYKCIRYGSYYILCRDTSWMDD